MYTKQIVVSYLTFNMKNIFIILDFYYTEWKQTEKTPSVPPQKPTDIKIQVFIYKIKTMSKYRKANYRVKSFPPSSFP